MRSGARIEGIVQSGHGDAAHWLTVFSEAYEAKLGTRMFPGSLNLLLAAPFDWFSAELQDGIIPFGRDEMGGERDVLLYPAWLPELDATLGFIWTTTIGASDRPDVRVVEFISEEGLRDRFGLQDGDVVVLQLGRTGGEST
ncbi:MAG: DUF120 domain-containing protein [Gemmatimonadota bacterium]